MENNKKATVERKVDKNKHCVNIYIGNDTMEILKNKINVKFSNRCYPLSENPWTSIIPTSFLHKSK